MLTITLVKIAMVVLYIIMFLATWRFYKHHVDYIKTAIDQGKAQTDDLLRVNHWFRAANRWLVALALVGMLMPYGWWVGVYTFITILVYIFAASASESLIISNIKHNEDESQYGSNSA